MIYIIALAGAYIVARPFFLISKLRKDVEWDLRDYYRGVRSFGTRLRELIVILERHDRLSPELNERLVEAVVLLEKAATWDSVAAADRNAVEVFEQTEEFMDSLLIKNLDGFERCKGWFHKTDDGLIETRRLLQRDIPRLNGSFVHRLGIIRKFMRIPTYPMRLPIHWDPGRTRKSPPERITIVY